MKGIRGVAALLVLLAVAAPAPATEPVASPSSPDFRVIAMFGGSPGDSRESLERSLAKGIRDVEVNFQATVDGHLVTAHDPDVGGDCGDVTLRSLADLAGCRNRHGELLATLPEVITMPFEGIWIDMRPDAVANAVEAIGGRPGATLMVYAASFDDVDGANVPIGLKAYPNTPDAIRSLADRAADVGATMICVEARWLAPSLVAYARDRGVGVLPWVGERTDPALLRELVRAGITGLIVSGATDLRPVVAP